MTEAQSEVSVVTCEEVKTMIDEGAEIVLVDTRLESNFQREPHIKGAINIPDTVLPPMTEQTIEAKLMGLPWNQSIIFYCDCTDDSGSIYLAQKLIDTGFNADNVKVLTGGFIRWQELGFPTEL